MVRFIVVTVAIASISSVIAHGGGHEYYIDGVTYYGNWDERHNTKGSIQREWDWNAVPDHTWPDMACRTPGTPHRSNSMHAPVQAGSTITVNYTTLWRNQETVYYGHEIGPMTAFMAACPDEGCEKADLNAQIWFKIFEAGLVNGTWANGYWTVRALYEGATWEIPTPASLKPGKYLLRHEVANIYSGGSQFFPNCIHLDVSGSGTRAPAPGELVSIPGAYDEDEEISFGTHRGSEWFWTEHADDTEYKIPGPPVWQG